MVVSFDAGAEPVFGRPRLVFAGNGQRTSGVPSRHYDISPDGRQFVTVATDASPRETHVVLHWLEELQARVSSH